MRLYQHDRDEPTTVPDAQLAAGFARSFLFTRHLMGWPLDRALPLYLALPEPSGLGSTFEQADYPALYEAVRAATRRGSSSGRRPGDRPGDRPAGHDDLVGTVTLQRLAATIETTGGGWRALFGSQAHAAGRDEHVVVCDHHERPTVAIAVVLLDGAFRWGTALEHSADADDTDDDIAAAARQILGTVRAAA